MALGCVRTLLLATVAAMTGCIVENHSAPADTEIEFQELTNLGYGCGGPLTSWTVSARETGDQGTAGCEQPVLFERLTPNAGYTFDIQGFSGQRLCWQGSCQVTAAPNTTTFADC